MNKNILLAVLGSAALALAACGGSESAKPGIEGQHVGIDAAGSGTGTSDTPAQGATGQTARAKREQARVVSQIRKKIERNWVRPAGWTRGMECMVRVHLAPSGEVLQVEVARSSGSPAFDRSVENAVHKASPLPLPKDKRLIEDFRELELWFRPEGQA
jgi:colicin import membrane protein